MFISVCIVCPPIVAFIILADQGGYTHKKCNIDLPNILCSGEDWWLGNAPEHISYFTNNLAYFSVHVTQHHV
jgi:hypothetical protein